MNVYEKMKALGITLPQPPPKGGVYAPAKRFAGQLVYVSGCGPAMDGPVTGKLGQEFTAEQGQALARACMCNVLAILQEEIGDLNRVRSAVKVLTFVAGTADFYQQPFVANGGTQLLADIFGGAVGVPARSAIGTNALPGNIPVETEALFEILPE